MSTVASHVTPPKDHVGRVGETGAEGQLHIGIVLYQEGENPGDGDGLPERNGTAIVDGDAGHRVLLGDDDGVVIVQHLGTGQDIDAIVGLLWTVSIVVLGFPEKLGLLKTVNSDSCSR